MNKIRDEIKKILLENFNYQDETNIYEIKNELNSYDFIKMILIIEDHYDINLSNDDTLNINTLTKRINEIKN